MNRTAKLFAQALATCADPYLRPGQWPVLMFLWASDGLSQAELVRTLHADDATIARTMDGLERDGLVRRERNPDDRRQVRVLLTDRGCDLRDVLIPCALGINRTAMAGLDEAERTQLFELLGRVRSSLEESVGAEPMP